MQQLEQELKLDVNEGWAFPDLSGVLPGLRAVRLPTLAMVTTYYDTRDLRLARQHVTLRYRVQIARPRAARTGRARPAAAAPPLGMWTVKLPAASDGSVLARTEVSWPAKSSLRARRPATSQSSATSQDGTATGPKRPPRVHPEAAKFLRALCLGLPLRSVARLETARRRVELRAPDGRRLAELDHDTVEGRRLVGARRTTRFSEVEVELAQGAGAEVLDAVAPRLRATGATPTPRVSKLAEILGPGAAGPGAAERGATQAASCLSVAAMIGAQLLCYQGVLLTHDPAIRLDDPDPEHVHKARVATRRLRSVLRAVRGSFWDDQLAELNQELRWLGNLLGTVRDADVRLEMLRQECRRFSAADSTGVSALLEVAGAEQRRAHEQLLEALLSDRYVTLLGALEHYEPRPGAPSSGALADAGLVALVHRDWRSLRREVKALDSAPSNEALHLVRIRAKRLRYTAELAATLPGLAPRPRPAVRRDAKAASPPQRKAIRRAAEAATDLQDVLGLLHDAVVVEAWLRGAASAAIAAPRIDLALVAGQLIATTRSRQAELRTSWPDAWHRLERAASAL